MNQATEAARYAGEVRLWSGRKRHLKWESECIKAFNSIIQGGSFEIVKRSMLRLQGAGFDIRSQVHDSVWLMVDSEKEIIEAEKIMADWTEELFELKFSVESKRLN
jgi:DNA polymerase I-like protein with 3'-5' exonuclease and polymerase domains